jgi:deoxyribonuclease-4|tara:strand:- start:3378 stop:4208 length:831 start_codon:yes stop_codon:yes gene_type:complete
MKSLIFGTAGTPLSSAGRDSIQGIKRVHELGLGCMELEFVRGVRMGADTAINVRKQKETQGIHLSVHAPYYLNLNSHEQKKIIASIERIYQSAYIGSLAGANNIVFHPAYYLKSPADSVYMQVIKKMELLIERLNQENIEVTLRPETTGKQSQFGTLEEVLRLSSELEGVKPCIDFAHLHARNGINNTYNEFVEILEMVENVLGTDGLKDMHLHVSGIEYGAKGEIKHLTLNESDFNYKDMLKSFKDYNVKGTIVCESPNLEIDAKKMEEQYQLGG